MSYLLVAALVAVVWYFLVRRRAPAALAPQVRVDRAAHVLRCLKNSGRDGSFAVFIFSPAGSDERDCVSLQYSVEGGRAGLDWVVHWELDTRNERDRDRFERFARDLGFSIDVRPMDDGEYLRIEEGDLALLATGVMNELYGLRLSDEVTLLVEEFELQDGSEEVTA